MPRQFCQLQLYNSSYRATCCRCRHTINIVLCYYFHVVYSTVLLKVYYSVTRSVLLITCRLQYCGSYAVLNCPFCEKDTVCTVGFNCSTFAALLQRYVTQCLRIIRLFRAMLYCLHMQCVYVRCWYTVVPYSLCTV